MLFSSSVFLMMFLPLTLLIYYLVPGRFITAKNTVLLIASLVFYGWGEPKYILVMLVSIVINYVLAIAIGKMKESKNEHGARLMLILDVIVNLGLLGFFKYTDFIIDTVNSLTGAGLGLLGIALPIGISFYTFQTMSYVIDVFRGKVPSQKNIITLAAYITLFPQLIAGPIVRYSDVELQLMNRTSDPLRIATGIRRFVRGFAKKILIANQVAVIWDEIYGLLESGESIGPGLAWIGAIAFTFQIYFDFSGYSDMAIGLGKLLGFDYLENFDYPYVSQTITEFWRRWHISLSSWFKEYVYIPLGGNRKGLARQLVNIAIVWALTGLWHGASWNFVLWGLYFGVFIYIERLIGKKRMKKIPAVIKHIFNNIVIVVGFGIFYFENLKNLGTFFGNLVGLNHNAFIDETVKASFVNNIFLIAAALIGCFPVKNLFKTDDDSSELKIASFGTLRIAYTVVLLAVSTILLVDSTNSPFLYFRF